MHISQVSFIREAARMLGAKHAYVRNEVICYVEPRRSDIREAENILLTLCLHIIVTHMNTKSTLFICRDYSTKN